MLGTLATGPGLPPSGLPTTPTPRTSSSGCLTPARRCGSAIPSAPTGSGGRGVTQSQGRCATTTVPSWAGAWRPPATAPISGKLRGPTPSCTAMARSPSAPGHPIRVPEHTPPLPSSPLTNSEFPFPESGVQPEGIDVVSGGLALHDNPDAQLSWADVLSLARNPFSEIYDVEATGEGTPVTPDQQTHSAYSFGALFCEVHVDPDLGKARVTRFTAAVGCGRIINPMTARIRC
jgi:Molybdopterin-binding domain of aldehyde dehydrogenase